MFPFRHPLPDQRKAFTLTEVLVVTVITGILALLLVTQVRALQRRGQIMTCAGNMRQLGGYILQYSTEYNGDLLPTLTRENGMTWHQILNQTGILPSGQYHQKKNSVMHCPARTSLNPRSYGNSLPSREYNGIHYGMSTWPGMVNMIEAGARPNKRVAIERPSQTLLLGEADWSYQIYPNLANHRISLDVHGGCNLLFADGHVEFYPGALPVYGAGQLKPDANIPPFLRK